MKTAWLVILMALISSGCFYINNVGKQTRLRVESWHAPTQSVNKHLIDREKFFVFDRLVGTEAPPGRSLVVVALSDRYRPNEIVDVNHVSHVSDIFNRALIATAGFPNRPLDAKISSWPGHELYSPHLSCRVDPTKKRRATV